MACIVLLLALREQPAAAGTPAGRRFALVVGANQGDSGDGTLKYAESDARRILNVLTAVGDVSPDNEVAVLGDDTQHLRRVLDEVVGRMTREAWGPKDLLFVYVSSHASEGELHLQGQRFPIHDLKAFLSEVPVGVAVLVLDTCDAGAAIREKGLRPLSGPVVSVEEPSLTGRVIIASSGAHESSLESDALQASYFTFNLEAGLRGAADTSHDGEVSLQEAFGYAYARTVEETTGAATGQQTPEYDVKLRGQGDLVLTEPGRAHGRLLLDLDQPGEFLVVSLNGSATVERFVKAAGPARFAIEPGKYRLRMRGDNGWRETLVIIPDQGETRITTRDFRSTDAASGRAKGARTEAWFVGLGGGVGTGAMPGLGALGRAQLAVRHEFESGILRGHTVVALDVSYQQGTAMSETSFDEREVETTVGVGLTWSTRWVQPRALIEGGTWLIHQSGVVGGTLWGLEAIGGVEGGLAVPIAGPAAVDVSITPGLGEVQRTTGWGLRPFINGSAGLGISF